MARRKERGTKIPIDWSKHYPEEWNDETTNRNESYIHKDTIIKVQREIGRRWIHLAHMMLSDAEIQMIQIDCKVYGEEEVVYQVISKWREKNPAAATVERLAQLLQDIGMRDLADKILGKNVFVCRENGFSEPVESQHDWNMKMPVWKFGFPDFSNVIPNVLGSVAGYVISKLPKLPSIIQLQIISSAQAALLPKYMALTMAALPWMDEIALNLDEYYVDVKLSKKDRKGGDVSSEDLTLQELLKNDRHSRRILVEGGPGYGKTTLVKKIAQDWAKKEEYVAHFDLVLVVHLREYMLYSKFEEMIIKSSGITSLAKEAFLSTFYDESNNMLLLLDGFDELPEERGEIVGHCLRSELPHHVTVVITSRPGKFATNRKGEKSTNEFNTSGNNFLDKRVTMKGLNPEEQESFVKKHTEQFSEEKRKHVTLKLESMVEKEYLECPLFLLMFIVLFTDNDGLTGDDPCATKTDLFKQVFNSVVRRYFSKHHPECDIVDLFAHINGYVEETGNLPLHVELVYLLGKFALTALKSETLVFTKRQILKPEHFQNPNVLELGFLKQNTFVEGFREEVHYQPVHKTLFEFAAAYFIWVAKTAGQTEEWKKQIPSNRPKLDENELSYVFPFLVGLFGNESGELFTILTPYATEYSNCFVPLGISLMQIEVTPSLLETLRPFLPEEWRVPWCANDWAFASSSQYEAIIEYGTKESKIKHLIWCIDEPFSFKGYLLELQTLEIIVQSPATCWNTMHCKKIRCNELLCSIRTEDVFEDDWTILLSLISSVSYRCISFCNHQFLSNMWLQHIHRCAFKDFNIHWSISVENLKSHGMVEDLIQREKAKVLRLYRQSTNLVLQHSAIERTVKTSGKSTSLKRFVCKQIEEAIPMILDINTLCDNGQKSWFHIDLKGAKLQFTATKGTIYKVQCLKLPSSEEYEWCVSAAEFLNCCVVKSLMCCHAKVIVSLTIDIPCYDTLQELHLFLDKTLIRYGLCRVLRHFKNLQTVALELLPKTLPPMSNSFWKKKNSIIHSKGFLSLRRLEIWWQLNNYSLAQDVVAEICSSIQKVCEVPSGGKEERKCRVQKLQLQCLAIRTTDLGINLEASEFFLSFVCQVRRLLPDRLVPAIQIICPYDFTTNMSRLTPGGITSWHDLFPCSEGFCLKRHLWGKHRHDPIWGREANISPNTNKHYVHTVTFKHKV